MKQGKISKLIQIVFAISILSFAIFAEETKEVNKGISQDVLNYVKKYSDFIKTKNQGKVDMVTTLNVSSEGLKQKMTFTSSLIFQKPNKVSFITKQEMGGSVGIICDGKKIYTYLDATRKYIEKDAPENLDLVHFNLGSQGFPTAELIVSSDPEKVIMEEVNSATVLGTEKIGEQEIVKIKFEQDFMDVELWLRTGDEPLIEKIIPDMNKFMAKSTAKQKGVNAEQLAEILQKIKKMKYNIVIEFKNWDLDKEFPEDEFKFTPPQGMLKSNNLCQSLVELRGENTEDALVGTDAPDFELKTLDNKTVKLSDHKGKNIVVLDFWATWCPPCRKALPVVVKATSAFKDKGVVFYAINQNEDTETINAFLKENEIECDVLLDKDAFVGKQYSVSAIPKTVIIGKDGKIKSVHSGFSEDMGGSIVEEIQKFLTK